MSYFMLFSMSVLVYAATVMTLLLDVHPMQLSPVKKAVFFVGIPLVILLNSVMARHLALDLFGKYYPLLGQLPMFLIFCAVSRRGVEKVFFVLLTTVFFTFPYTLLSVLTGKLTQSLWQRAVVVLLGLGFLVWAINAWMKADFDYAMDFFTPYDILKFSAIPIFNNILNYSIGHYTAVLSTLPLRGLVFLSGMSAYFLTLNVFRRTREMQQMQSEQILMGARMAAVNEQLASLRQTQEQATIYRHDMRHHFALIGGYLADGEISNAMEYLRKAQAGIDVITPTTYCRNHTVNLILSSFVSKAMREGVVLQVEADLPPSLPLPETELCAILSNGLENAVFAAARIDAAEKLVTVSCQTYKGKLLLSIENSYQGEVVMENGAPKRGTEGHGFGVKSIEMLTKKYDGYCAFAAQDHRFSLKVVLPLAELSK
ncbi:MAG: GHKL domain-containing protein [Oscillospiraceae bacterium]